MKTFFALAFLAAGCFCGVEAASDPYDYKELVARKVEPVGISRNAAGRKLVDFGLDAVGWLELDGPAAGPYEIVIGEFADGKGSVKNPFPRSAIRCFRVKGMKTAGTHRVALPPDRLNLRGLDPKAPAILLPEKFGIVAPFRYVEVVSAPEAEFRQMAVNYPIDMSKSFFSCDNRDLERVYGMCKYSILATSFCGIYVDGDRERTPYEADAYINQLCHYAIDDDCSLARKSHEWLMEHPTWPTEWRQHSIMMAWADWMWSGSIESARRHYGILKEKLLLDRSREDGLLASPPDPLVGKRADIIDWPPRERDGYVFCPASSVVNAFHYLNLRQMADIAKALGKSEDASFFAGRASKVRVAYRKTFRDGHDGLYVDGEGTRHKSLHANVAALAFGLAEESEYETLADYIVSKGMKCSVYFAQYFLEALFISGRDKDAIAFMAARGNRSWLGMMDQGSTMTLEAWNMEAKPNLDWNHAWGTPPLNIIARFVLGVKPLAPGFAKVEVRPQTGGLKYVRGTVPTVKGPVTVEVKDGKVKVDVPSSMELEGGETRK